MKNVFHPSAVILNRVSVSTADTANGLPISADANEFWVLQKLWVSHDASGTTDFDNLNSVVRVLVKFAASEDWDLSIHPGNGGTNSLEFEAGPWEFDFSPGLYTGTKNEAMVITVGAFGTGIVSRINILYQ